MNKHDYIQSSCSSTVTRLTAILGSCLLGFLLSIPLALAQTGEGTVTGTVTDLSQAIVPNAGVTLTHVTTGVATKGQSNEAGIFYFGAVPIGDYKIAVNKEGFEEWVGTFTLSVGQNAVVNPTLKVGSATTVVEVSAAAAPIETQSGAVGDIKESAQIRDLPLNGRQIGNLFDLTAGVESGAGGARVNGMKVGALDINLDGATLVNRFGGGIVSVQPGIETIQEFNIQTVGSDARYDQPSTVVMATRSGSNQLHGAGYEYLRDNTVIGATRLRTDPVGSAFHLPLLIRNEFGGYLSGPVYLPHVYNGKDKSFWFFDYEALRQHTRTSSDYGEVPTAAMWQGDLSNAFDPSTNQPLTIYNPTTTNPATFQRTAFTNNQIPGPFSPTAMELKSLTALPTNNNNPYIEGNFNATYPRIQSNGSPTIKWDQNLSDKDRLSVRYTRASETALLEGGYYANPISDNTGMGTSVRNYQTTNVAVNYNRTISPNWLNELLVGVLREPNHSGTVGDFVNWDSKLDTPNPFGVTGWPTMYTFDSGGNFYGEWDSDNNKQQHLTSETIEDNVTWTHSKHTIQFGFRGRKEQNNIEELQQAQGQHEWDPSYTSLYSAQSNGAFPDSGSGFAELLLGLPDYLSNQYNRGFFYFRQTEIGLYGTDRIKLTPRLTLNLGLRWDYFTPYTEARNRMVLPYAPDSKFAMMTPGNIPMTSLGSPASALAAWSGIGLTWLTAASQGYPSDLFSPIHHDFGPRLGAAYQLNHNTVIRGSYGIYYVPEPLNLLLQSMRTNPPINLRYVTNPWLYTNVPGGASGKYFGLYPLISAPASTDYLPPVTVNTVAGAPPPSEGNGVTYWDAKNWNDSRDQTWNFTVEHELPYHTGMRLSYIGTYGGALLQNYAVNDVEPSYNYALRTGLIPPSDSNQARLSSTGTPGVINWGVIANNHTGYSRDHSFQAEVHRTFSNGVAFQAFYTFTRQLNTDDPSGSSLSSTSVNGGTGGGNLNGNGGEPVPENFELLGEPSLSFAQREKLIYFNSINIPPHNVTFNGIYDLPFGKGKYFARNASAPLNYLIGGWQVTTIGVWHSGLWMGVNPGLVQPSNIRIPAGQRATLTVSGSQDKYRQWFAGITPAGATTISGTLVAPVVREAGPNCEGQYVGQLAVPLPVANETANGGQTCYDAPFGGFYNPAPRNNIIGPGAWDDDFSLYKHFKIGERFDMRFAADFFNFTNHPNDNPPNSSSGLQDISKQNTNLNSPRQIQLSLRVEF
jgi:hypothetical protein